ncbi:MAG: Type 2 DNA topoisomerase 6 subunit B [Candidatus Thorarchaeota archaeon]|nr:MAG: Type 2 DNA topoisomerase 6 subunit B [Candidatus Thorarchaeota archaeon]
MQTVKPIETDVVELSVSAWFYRNRTIAGFDNPARSLYVSIRELVENSLDASEDAGYLPEVKVTLSRISERSDLGDLFSAGPEEFKLRVEDNGGGIPRSKVPKLIGKMLTGTKFMLRQNRGTFGLGGSLALLYGQVTTQKPIKICTAIPGENLRHELIMRLDIEQNTPKIIRENSIRKDPDDHGTIVEFALQGDWIRSKTRIADYFTQTSIIVPYASIIFSNPDGETLTYKRLIETLPRRPKDMKPHPEGIDVEMLKQMIRKTKKNTLSKFFMKAFQRVGTTTAQAFLDYAELDPDIPPKTLKREELVALMNAMASYDKFLPPSPKSLSPAGEAVLEAGLKRLEPEFVAVSTRSPSVYEGHPFIIETAVAYGGGLQPGINLLRFANRIPLLYDERSDVSSRVIRDLRLKNYELKQEDPLVFLTHICSTKVPYKTVGKEFIGDVDAVRREVDLGFKECLRRVSEGVRKKNRAKRKARRENKLQTYYEFLTDTLSAATGRQISSSILFGDER